jgi:hypothetical protein
MQVFHSLKNQDKIRGSIKYKSHQVHKLLVLCQVALFDLTNKGETRELGTPQAVNTYSQEDRAKPTQQPGTQSYTGNEA